MDSGSMLGVTITPSKNGIWILGNIKIDTRLCAGANITNVKGLTPAQTVSLIALVAIDRSK